MTFNDLAALDRSFGNLNDTINRNRMLKLQKQRFEQEQQRLQQQSQAVAQYRNQSLDEKTAHEQADEGLRRKLLDIEAQKAQTAQAAQKSQATKNEKLFYVYTNDGSGNAIGPYPDIASAQQVLNQTKAKKPDADLYISPEPPKEKVPIASPDGSIIHVDPNKYAETYEIFQKAKQQKPVGFTPRQEIRQVLNPAHVANGVVDTNTPAFLSLTNTTTPLNIPLPDQAPSGVSPTGKVRKYNPATGQIE
jgi:hypothetical protein